MHPHPADTIAEFWPDLLAATEPGTRRRTNSLARPIAEAIVERDRIERAERSTLARGVAPAPATVHVIDVIRDVTAAVRYVEAETREALRLPYLVPAPSADTDTPSACRRILGYRRMLTVDQAAWIETQLRPAARAVLTAVGLDERPVTLLQPCPWCGGPLTVHAVTPVGPHVLCSGDAPCDAVSSTWLYGRPLWHLDDLGRLGALLHVPTRSARQPLKVNLHKAA
ncbi:hypothetical protein [Yinghuangia soli]|uniref:Uncharacterized protein n=1 Tax=Yinghuangia soli TaxID=2908204 RepID=A0AA41U792_9ACTN|nr:hypothetical protein [Yinghuangia soli]MCF2531734.1 hypothetical protein [Yinghuangia soli]